MIDLSKLEVWFLTGSQHLYGPETLEQVAAHSQEIVGALNDAGTIPVQVVFKPVLTTPEEIHRICMQANAAPNCIGVITWMHTFSPSRNVDRRTVGAAKAAGASAHAVQPRHPVGRHRHGLHEPEPVGARRPRVRLHHEPDAAEPQGGRRALAAIRKCRSGSRCWARAAAAWHDAQGAKVARFGDNMRSVAVTEGDKVEAQMRFGYERQRLRHRRSGRSRGRGERRRDRSNW